MRLLAVCESPPTLHMGAANGATLISAQVLPRLADDIDIDLVWFADRAAEPTPELLARCSSSVRLPLRPLRSALAALPVTRLPRATWQRAGGDDVVRRLAEHADVVYLHGLHVFSSAPSLAAPVVAHEIDPWSHYWRERAGQAGPARGVYDRVQARRAQRLERAVAAVAARYLVVNHDDAARLSVELDRNVDAVPNGVDLARFWPRGPDAADPDLLVFVGTLDYPPNVAAVTELCTQVLPRIRALRPQTRLVVAGRRPVPQVHALAGDGVEVLGQVDDVRDVYARAAVAVYPGALGRGTKNTVLEALAVGCPVVCSPEAARGLAPGEHLALGADAEQLASQALDLLADPERRQRVGAAAAAVAHGLPDWDEVAQSYEGLLRTAAQHRFA